MASFNPDGRLRSGLFPFPSPALSATFILTTSNTYGPLTFLAPRVLLPTWSPSICYDIRPTFSRPCVRNHSILNVIKYNLSILFRIDPFFFSTRLPEDDKSVFPSCSVFWKPMRAVVYNVRCPPLISTLFKKCVGGSLLLFSVLLDRVTLSHRTPPLFTLWACAYFSFVFPVTREGLPSIFFFLS